MSDSNGRPIAYLTTIVFTTCFRSLWSGLCLHRSIAAVDAHRQVSTPSHYWAWLGVVILQISPTLMGSTLTVSNKALILYKAIALPLC